MKSPASVLPSKLAETDVAVVGLGLMGGSLAGALRGHCRTIIGVARRKETIETAQARGLIDHGTTNLAHGVRRAAVVVLSTPVLVILDLLDEIGSMLPHGCLVMDLGSTKARIVAKMAHLPPHVQPIGGHPMCGKETSRIDAAEPALFRGKIFILSPLTRTSETALAMGQALVQTVGAHPLIVQPNRHDRLVATISHLPYLLACALVGTTADAASKDPTVWDVAASGFRDTSRLAASDVTVMLDILLTNQDAVLAALTTCETHIQNLIRLIDSGDKEGLLSTLTTMRNHRIGNVHNTGKIR